MSVILAYQVDNKITVAADNRLSNAENTIVSDAEEKIIVVNNHLAIAFSGNHAVQTMFQNFFENKTNLNTFYVEDVLLQFETFYRTMKISNEEYAKNIIRTSSGFIVAGKNKNHENVIYGVSFINGQLTHSLTTMILFPPADVSMADCSKIFAKYYHTDFNNCAEKTIKKFHLVVNWLVLVVTYGFTKIIKQTIVYLIFRRR